MRRFPVAVVLIAGSVCLLLAIAIAAVVTAFNPPKAAPRLAASAVPSPYEEEPAEDRLPAGTALPLTLDPDTRHELSLAVSVAGGDADALQTPYHGGVAYYGEIYGETSASDNYYVVIAGTAHLHYWTRTGSDAWHYEGGYDARQCIPPAPAEMYAAWGTRFSTEAPGAAPPACAAG